MTILTQAARLSACALQHCSPECGTQPCCQKKSSCLKIVHCSTRGSPRSAARAASYSASASIRCTALHRRPRRQLCGGETACCNVGQLSPSPSDAAPAAPHRPLLPVPNEDCVMLRQQWSGWMLKAALQQPRLTSRQHQQLEWRPWQLQCWTWEFATRHLPSIRELMRTLSQPSCAAEHCGGLPPTRPRRRRKCLRRPLGGRPASSAGAQPLVPTQQRPVHGCDTLDVVRIQLLNAQ